MLAPAGRNHGITTTVPCAGDAQPCTQVCVARRWPITGSELPCQASLVGHHQAGAGGVVDQVARHAAAAAGQAAHKDGQHCCQGHECRQAVGAAWLTGDASEARGVQGGTASNCGARQAGRATLPVWRLWSAGQLAAVGGKVLASGSSTRRRAAPT